MEEKNNKVTKKDIIFDVGIFLFVAIVSVLVFIFVPSNEQINDKPVVEKEEEKISKVDEEKKTPKVDEEVPSISLAYNKYYKYIEKNECEEEICEEVTQKISLREDKTFIYLFENTVLLGTYEIKEDKLILTQVIEYNDTCYKKIEDTNKYEFSILSENEIKIVNDELEMTFTLSNEEEQSDVNYTLNPELKENTEENIYTECVIEENN